MQMIRQAFVMKLKPGALPKYREYHENVWPELLEEIKTAGISKIIICENDPYLYVYSEVTDENAWNRLWTSEVHRKWGEHMNPLLEFGPDGLIDSTELNEVFFYQNPDA